MTWRRYVAIFPIPALCSPCTSTWNTKSCYSLEVAGNSLSVKVYPNTKSEILPLLEAMYLIFICVIPNYALRLQTIRIMNGVPEEARRSKVSLCKLLSNRPDIVSLFESMVPYFDSGIQPTEELLNLKMTEGVYVLLNTNKNLYASLFDFADPWKIDILEFLEKNYMNDLSLEEIANYTGRSLATFKRDFKKISDLSPQKWIIRRRLEAAHTLIQSGNRKVTDICFDVGFKNLSHFSKVYKERYSCSPVKSMNN